MEVWGWSVTQQKLSNAMTFSFCSRFQSQSVDYDKERF